MSELVAARELVAEQQRATRAPQPERVRAAGAFDLSSAMADSQGFNESRSGSPQPLRVALTKSAVQLVASELAPGMLANLTLAQLAEATRHERGPMTASSSQALERVAAAIVARVSVTDHVAVTEIDLGEHGSLKLQVTLEGKNVVAELESPSRALVQSLMRNEGVLRSMLAADGLALASLRVAIGPDTLNEPEQFDNDRQHETDSESSLLSLIRRASSVL